MRKINLNPVLMKSTVVAGLGGLLFGFDTAVISGTTAARTVIGSMLAGFPGEKIGRRDSLRLMAVLYMLSGLGCAFAWRWPSLVGFRFLGGLGIGGSSVIGPMYTAEISPARLRGRLVGAFQFNIVFGILLAYFSNYVIGLRNFGASEWRWELGITAAPAALFFLILFGIPRSPRWLVKVGRVAEARRVLQLTGEENYERELQDIIESIRAEREQAGEALFTRAHLFPSETFPLTAATAGGYPFVFFSTMMLVQFFVVLFIYPETKGVTLEQMQKQLAVS